MDEPAETVLSNTYTKASLYHRYALVREFSGHEAYNERQKEPASNVVDRLTAFLEEKEESRETIEAMAAWGSSFWQEMTKGAIEQPLRDLYRSFEKVVPLVMYVPVELPPHRTAEMCQWLRAQTSPYLILDIRVTQEIDIGCAFSYRNQYYDYSYRRRIHGAQGAIVDMVKEYNSAPQQART
jgi:hypothetical protein